MTYTKQTFGLNDPHFAGVTAYSKDGAIAAVEIPNAGRSGSTFYEPDAKLVGALAQLGKADTGKDKVARGQHAAAFANGMDATHNGFGNRFYIDSTVEALSTNKMEGANNAVRAVHQKLESKGLTMSPFNETIIGIQMQFAQSPVAREHAAMKLPHHKRPALVGA